GRDRRGLDVEARQARGDGAARRRRRSLRRRARLRRGDGERAPARPRHDRRHRASDAWAHGDAGQPDPALGVVNRGDTRSAAGRAQRRGSRQGVRAGRRCAGQAEGGGRDLGVRDSYCGKSLVLGGTAAMRRATILFAAGLCANVLIALPAIAQAPAELTLTRIDCGTGAQPTDVGQRFTDTFAYKDLKLTFTFSCYLIKHGDEYMVWDTGFAPGTNPNAPKVGIVDRLKELRVTPEQVKWVGISHFHGDHTGQL